MASNWQWSDMSQFNSSSNYVWPSERSFVALHLKFFARKSREKTLQHLMENGCASWNTLCLHGLENWRRRNSASLWVLLGVEIENPHWQQWVKIYLGLFQYQVTWRSPSEVFCHKIKKKKKLRWNRKPSLSAVSDNLYGIWYQSVPPLKY